MEERLMREKSRWREEEEKRSRDGALSGAKIHEQTTSTRPENTHRRTGEMNALGRVLNVLGGPGKLGGRGRGTQTAWTSSLFARCFSLTAARPKLWTQEEVEKLERLRSEGKSRKEIAEALNRSYASLNARMNEARSSEPLRRTASRTGEPWTEAELQTLKDARARGETIASIARLLDRSLLSIDVQLTRHVRQVSPHRSMLYREAALCRRSWTQEEHDSAMRLREQGLTYKAIGLTLGRHAASVQSRLTRSAANGWPGRFNHQLTGEETAQIARLYHDGKTISQIHAEELPHRSRCTIDRAIQRLKDPTRTEGKEIRGNP